MASGISRHRSEPAHDRYRVPLIGYEDWGGFFASLSPSFLASSSSSMISSNSASRLGNSVAFSSPLVCRTSSFGEKLETGKMGGYSNRRANPAKSIDFGAAESAAKIAVSASPRKTRS